MIDFSTLQGLSIPEGVVTEIADASGRVLWVLASDEFDGTFMVEKIIDSTYAGSTEYPNEEFIALDIYPRSGGTVNVTYEGVTKTITDGGTSEVPNAQTVTFGTFNGVIDATATPASGIVTISGDWRAAGCGSYKSSKYTTSRCICITAVGDLSGAETIPANAFGDVYGGCIKIKKVKIPDGVKSIATTAFLRCTGLRSVSIPSSVTTIANFAFQECSALKNLSVSSDNQYYATENGVLFNKGKTQICSAPAVSGHYIIPSSVTTIFNGAFYGNINLTGLTIPSGVVSFGYSAFSGCTALTDVTFDNTFGWYTATTAGAASGTPVNVRDIENTITLLISATGNYWYYTPDPFTFTVVDQTASGIYGMTWAEWIESEYNTTGLTYDGSRINSPDGLFLIVKDPVQGWHLVDPTLTYTLSDGTFTVTIYNSNSSAAFDITAEYGMTWRDWATSEYYNTNITVAESYVHNPVSSLQVNGVNVHPDDVISANVTYKWTEPDM